MAGYIWHIIHSYKTYKKLSEEKKQIVDESAKELAIKINEFYTTVTN